MNQFKLFLTVLAVAAFVYACDKSDEDTVKPLIEIDEPSDGDTMFIGYDVHLEMELSDNEKLKSYKVDIHNDFDDHGHNKSGSADAAWTFTKSWDVSGLKNTHVHHHEISVPVTINGSPIAKGKYHFMVYCTDEAGNESYVVKSLIVGVGVPKEDE